MNTIRRTILALLVLLLGSACDASQLFEPTATLTPTVTPTSTPIPPTLTATLPPTLIPTAAPLNTPIPTLSPIDQIVDGYLTAIEHDDWQAAYDTLCPKIQAQLRTPQAMYERILKEVGAIPDSHTILPPPDRPYRVLFILSRTEPGSSWVTGVREARVEADSLKVCGVGAKHGDLRYLLQIGSTEPLNIAP